MLAFHFQANIIIDSSFLKKSIKIINTSFYDYNDYIK